MILQTNNTNNNSKTTQIMKRIYLQSKKRNLLKVLSTAMLVLVLSFNANAQTLKDVTPLGKYLGVIYPNSFSTTQQNIAKTQFSAMTTENLIKMDNILQNYNGTTFPDVTAADLNLTAVNNFIQFCSDNGLRKRGHTLMWYNQVPSWLQAKCTNSIQIKTFMQNYITALVGALAGKIDEWDVANEMLSDSGSGYRTGTWYANITVGNPGLTSYSAAVEDLLANCFIWAHEADPAALLYYNDYCIEYNSVCGNGKSNSAYSLVSTLINKNAPIDGVGFQTHFTSGNFGTNNTTAANIVTNIKKYANLTSTPGSTSAGSPILAAITEFDIRAASATTLTAAQKEAAYFDMISQTLAEPNCNLFLIWGMSECCSWIPGTFPSDPVPYLLYNSSYVQNGTTTTSGAWKGAYDALNGLSILGVNDFAYNNKLVTISPNPADTKITISGLTSSDKSFVVTDILGKNILKKTVVSDLDTTIDVSQLQSGLYFLKTVSGKSAKIIKK
jgi:GH35 family endo-1,4-beta-xylanase